MLGQQNHAAGGANGSIMVVVFVCLCLASTKPSEREFFIPAGTDLGVKLLTSYMQRVYIVKTRKKISITSNITINSLTAMVAYLRPLFFELRHCLITFRIFVRCQRLIARNVANGFLLNCGASH
jgi:hypothetical protein